jgi:hypothetical protein
MKKRNTLCLNVFLLLTLAFQVDGQTNLDTLAIQDFEIVPATPTCNINGPVISDAGFSGAGGGMFFSKIMKE